MLYRQFVKKAGVILGLVLLTASLLSGCFVGEQPELLPSTGSDAGGAEAAGQNSESAGEPVAKAGDRVYVSADDGLLVVDGTSGKVEQSLPNGVPSPDWSTLYTVERSLGRTTVQALDVASGEVLREVSVEGSYQLPVLGIGPAAPAGLSPNGEWLALQHLGGSSPPDDSHFVVLDTAFTQTPHRLDLDGSLHFDALSNDGRSLYLIEDVNASRYDLSTLFITQYHVRVYDVGQGALDPGLIADKRSGGTVMTGSRMAAVNARDGQWVFSLYLNAEHGPFVHALNLDTRAATCIFLPTDGHEDMEKQLLWSIALAPDGRTLYAVNGALDLVAEIDTAQLSVRRTAELGRPEARQPGLLQRLSEWLVPTVHAKRLLMGGLAVAPDGRTLYAVGESGVLEISTADLSLRATHLEGMAPNSLALSPDGRRLYMAGMEQSGVVILDTASGERLHELPASGTWFGVMRVETP